jgi:phage gpG-like protein
MDITVNTDASKFNQVTMALASQLRNTQSMLEEIGVHVERSIKLNFRQGGRPTKWKPSKERAKNKAARIKRATKGLEARKQKTLVDTGNLQSSITHQVKGGAVYVGTNVLYAAIHHFGGTINHPGGTPYMHFGGNDIVFLRKSSAFEAGKKTKQQKGIRKIRKGMKSGIEIKFTKPHPINMPARPFLMLQAEDYKRIDNIMKKHIRIEKSNV